VTVLKHTVEFLGKTEVTGGDKRLL